MRSLIVLCTFLACACVQAQALPEEPSQPIEGRRNQKVERIRIEDSGARIDELRYGGQTQSIVVQPKADVPEYEFQPTDLSRSRPADRDGQSSPSSARVWNLLRF
jgi:hypothetical protein